jgi:hypothetical protein
MIMGERIKDNLTGEVFEVKKIVKEWRLLRDGTSRRQCLTGLNSLNLLYEKAPEGFLHSMSNCEHGCEKIRAGIPLNRRKTDGNGKNEGAGRRKIR